MAFGQSRYAEINSLLNAKFAEKGTLIAAHRGSWHGNIIQNTLAAYRAAIMMGADIVETDTTATRDNVVFSLHDGVEPVLLGPSFNSYHVTSEQLGRFNALNALGVPCLQQIETLETIFEGLTHGELINIDRTWRARGLVPALLDKHPHMLHQALLKAPPRERGVIEQLNEHPQKYMFMAICHSIRDIDEVLQFDALNLVGIELVEADSSAELCQPETIRYIHSKGLFTWVNSLVLTDADPIEALYGGYDDDISIKQDPALGWGHLMDMGIDVIQTDWPSLVRDYRRSRTGR